MSGGPLSFQCASPCQFFCIADLLQSFWHDCAEINRNKSISTWKAGMEMYSKKEIGQEPLGKIFRWRYELLILVQTKWKPLITGVVWSGCKPNPQKTVCPSIDSSVNFDFILVLGRKCGHFYGGTWTLPLQTFPKNAIILCENLWL